MESKSVLNFYFVFCFTLEAVQPSVARGWQPTGWVGGSRSPSPSPASCWMESVGQEGSRRVRRALALASQLGFRMHARARGTGRDPIFLRFYFWQPIKCARTLDWSHARAAYMLSRVSLLKFGTWRYIYTYGTRVGGGGLTPTVWPVL